MGLPSGSREAYLRLPGPPMDHGPVSALVYRSGSLVNKLRWLSGSNLAQRLLALSLSWLVQGRSTLPTSRTDEVMPTSEDLVVHEYSWKVTSPRTLALGGRRGALAQAPAAGHLTA